MAAETRKSAEATWGDRSQMRYLNNDVPRVDGRDKVTGRAKYTHDIRLPGMVYARFLCCPHAAADVELDLAPALATPGVVDAISILPDDVGSTLFLGQPVAAVAAETMEAADDGIRALGAKFTERPWVVTYEQAIADDAPRVHDDGNVRRRRESDSGDWEAALGQCDAVVEGTFTVPIQHHVSLETHGHVVDYRGDSATVYGSTQATFALMESADHLELDSDKVEGTVQHMGGGFGSKFGMGVEGRAACMLAKRIGRPVHFMLNRRDEFLMAGNRSGNVAKLRAGATADGKLQVVWSDSSRLGGLAGGSYASQPYIYDSETHFSAAQSVHTNTDGNRAMRAPGHPQASFGMESVVDMLAYELGHDPLEFRIQNLSDEVYHRQLRRVASEIGWYEHPNRISPGSWAGEYAEGIGFGVSTWGGGGRPSCETEVKIGRDGSLVVEVGTQDLGTGTRTYVTTIVAEEFGRPIEGVTARIGRTIYGRANGSGGSVTTGCLAPSVKLAAHNAREAMIEVLRPVLENVGDGDIDVKTLDWYAACAALPAEGITANGTWDRSLQASGVRGAQAVRVRVDLLTGRVQPLKMVCVQDVGLPLNRLAVRSQMNGGMIQALSYGLFEQRVIDPWLGMALNANLEDYKVLGSLEMPEMVAIIDDEDIDRPPIGVGEPVVIPGQSALANAIYNACGVRLFDMPFTPDKVLMALEALRS